MKKGDLLKDRLILPGKGWRADNLRNAALPRGAKGQCLLLAAHAGLVNSGRS